MFQQRFKQILLLISTVSLISFGTYHFVARKQVYAKASTSDSAFVISDLQLKINSYCHSRATLNSEESILKREQLEVKNAYELLYLKKVALEKDEQRKNSKQNQQKLNKGKNSKDSVLRAIYAEITTEIHKLDSSIYLKRIEIEALQNNIRKIEQEMLVQKERFIKCKYLHDSIISGVRNSLTLTSGSLALEICGVKYRIYIANLEQEIVRMHLYYEEKKNFFKLDEVKQFLEKKALIPRMITNAGMFSPSYEPVGLYLEEGSKVSFGLNTSKKASFENFYLYPNGVFYIDSLNRAFVETTAAFTKLKTQGKLKLKMATQSGPMLLIKGQIHKKFTQGSVNAKIRSGVGKVNDKRIVFAATINGSNFYDFATFFKDFFACKDALFLDGAISQMYLKDASGNMDGYFGPMISVCDK